MMKILARQKDSKLRRAKTQSAQLALRFRSRKKCDDCTGRSWREEEEATPTGMAAGWQDV